MRKAKIFAGSSHPDLAALIVERLGTALAPLRVTMKSNHEMTVELGTSVRGHDVFLVQSGSDATNDHLMELLLMIDCCRANSAGRITTIIPTLPYGKSCRRKPLARTSISARLVAKMLHAAGVDHVITLDMHSDQAKGFFNMPVDNLIAEPTLCRHLEDISDCVAVAKNPAAVKRVTAFADRLKIDFALIHRDTTMSPDFKGRVDPPTETSPISFSLTDEIGESVNNLLSQTPEVSEDGLQLIGSVVGRNCLIIEDTIDSAKSFLAAASLLRRKGAVKIMLVATHGVFSGDALLDIERSLYVDGVIVTNSCSISEEKRSLSSKLRVIDISSVIAESIRRTHNSESISFLFNTAL